MDALGAWDNRGSSRGLGQQGKVCGVGSIGEVLGALGNKENFRWHEAIGEAFGAWGNTESCRGLGQ